MTRQAIWQAKRRAKGLCTICGLRKLVNLTRCRACRKLDLERKKNNYNAMKGKRDED